MDIENVRRAHEAALLSLPNVTGVGIGERRGVPVIKVFVTRKVPAADLQPHEVVPKSLQGYPTDVDEIGVVMAQPH